MNETMNITAPLDVPAAARDTYLAIYAVSVENKSVAEALAIYRKNESHEN